jgi:hypothetical protein
MMIFKKIQKLLINNTCELRYCHISPSGTTLSSNPNNFIFAVRFIQRKAINVFPGYLLPETKEFGYYYPLFIYN